MNPFFKKKVTKLFPSLGLNMWNPWPSLDSLPKPWRGKPSHFKQKASPQGGGRWEGDAMCYKILK